jgi:hypothetical protein
VAAPNEVIFSDGVNYRLANQTGCPVGAVVTTAGSAMVATAPPVVTVNTGASIWRPVIGGAISTSVTVSNGGTNYTYPPIVLIAAPPPGGVPATAYCTLSGTAVSTVTVVDQGAGYNTPPTITFVNDPREGLNAVASGYGAAAVTTLTGAGTMTALVCIDHGTGGQTAVNTLAFSAGGSAATVIMDFSITAYTTTGGSGYAAPMIVSGYAAPPGSSVLLNPTIQANLVKGRNAFLVAAVASSVPSATGQVVYDGGVYPAVPTLFAYGFIPGASATQATLGATVGGQNDVSVVYPT